MRSSERRFNPLWLSCLLLVIVGSPAWAQVSGQITGVTLEPENKRIVVESKGKVGDHLARVLARPNRLILDFKDTGVEKVPGRINITDNSIKEIRTGSAESRARIVIDFREHPVPAFHVKREENRVLVVFGKGMGVRDLDDATGPVSRSETPAPLPQAQSLGVGQASPDRGLKTADKGPTQADAAKANTGWTVGTWAGTATAPPQAAPAHQRRMAQSLDFNTPSSSVREHRGRTESGKESSSRGDGSPASSSLAMASSQGVPDQRQMVREVRPPVTPPTPDPRLLVQEVTELQFIQVGHNSRLIVRGGDHLDYRLNNVSPTKVRIDLINAEIPKSHQKPLRTDLFSTSVEMIVPGSQTIFVQLKDAVPFQVEKQKGVLMIDFPPPRFAMSPDQKKAGGSGKTGEGDSAAREAFKRSSEDRKQAVEAIREQEILKSNEMRRKSIESLQKQQEELEKQRTEILKRYRITPDPQIFNKPVSMDFQGISLKNAFRLLAEQAGVNIILDDKVTGTTTLRLFQVPLGQVIDTILNSHNLDREMVGNVMRVGPKKDIEELKKARLAEYEKRIGEVDSRLKQLSEDIKGKTDESAQALKSLEKTSVEAEEPKEDVKSEEIGEAGCIKIGNKDICFFYSSIKLVYADPASVVRTLKCMFNLQCEGLPQAPPAASAEKKYAGELTQQGFSADSPGFVNQMNQFQQTQAQMQQARAQSQTAATIGQAAQGLPPGQPAGPSLDPDLAKVIMYSMIWPDPTNRIVFIKDTSERISQMKKVIYGLDVPKPQVTIDGRLVEAAKTWSRALGVLWGGRNNQNGPLTDVRTSYWGVGGLQGGATANTATGQSTSGNNIPSSFAVNLPAALAGATNPISALGVQFGLLANQTITELDARLQLGEATGQTKTVSRPKVTVLNKEKGSIKNGKQIPYQVTGSTGTQTQMINADLLLEVTPEIFPDGRVKMDLKFTNNEPDLTFTPPAITTREATTIMTVKDGETAVIGGIIKNVDGSSRQGWPGLMNVPVINFLFSNKSTSSDLAEILMFITPVIVKKPPSAS